MKLSLGDECARVSRLGTLARLARSRILLALLTFVAACVILYALSPPLVQYARRSRRYEVERTSPARVAAVAALCALPVLVVPRFGGASSGSAAK